MFAFAIVWAIYGQDGWGYSMTIEAFGIILIGTSVFVAVSIFFAGRFQARCSIGIVIPKEKSRELSEISITRGAALGLLIIHLFVAFYYIITLIQITGVTDLTALPSTYRNSYMSGAISLPFFARLCMNLMRGASVISTCVISNNLIIKKFRDNRGFVLLACLTIYILLTLASGERTSVLRVLAVFVISFAVFWKRQYPNESLLTFKRAIGMIAGSAVFLYGFSAIRHVVGRSSTLNFFDYIAFYVGAPIYNLDFFVTTAEMPSMTGELTFLGTYNNLARLGFGVVKTVSRAGVSIPERHIYMGNVYTSYYDYLSDFGIVGLVVLTIIYAFIINALYQYAKRGSGQYLIRVACYSFFGTTLFFAAFTEQFFSSYFTVSTIEMLAVMLLLALLFDEKKKPRKIRNLF